MGVWQGLRRMHTLCVHIGGIVASHVWEGPDANWWLCVADFSLSLWWSSCCRISWSLAKQGGLIARYRARWLILRW